MPKTVAITSKAGQGDRGLQTGGGGRQARQEGTTPPVWSEALWAQVGRATPKVRTQRRGTWQADARLEGESQRTTVRRDVRDQTSRRRAAAEGSRPHCVGPELEAVLGKTHRTAL